MTGFLTGLWMGGACVLALGAYGGLVDGNGAAVFGVAMLVEAWRLTDEPRGA